MNSKILFPLIFAGFVFSSCQPTASSGTQKTAEVNTEADVEQVPYVIAKRYFVKNTVEKIPEPKIGTKGEFDDIFGSAPVMGKEGKPTTLDFTTQYVIAVTLPETNFAIDIDPVSLTRNQKKEVILTYKISVGDKQTYLTKPIMILAVDKAYDGTVILRKEGE